jgi:hypothetical protein
MGRNPSTRAPVYQVDFTAQGSGKHVGMSKKKAVFKFGYANEQALADGAVGVDCRGQEHEVTCIWSVASGKRQIFVDGQPAHHSVTENMKKRFILSFPFMNHHVMKLTIHAAPPLSKTKNGEPQRQYDLLLDGQSFFEFARLFELGRGSARMAGDRTAIVARSNNGGSNDGGAQYTNYSLDDRVTHERSATGSPRGVGSYESEYYGQAEPASPAFARSPLDQEEADLKAAIEASLREEGARTRQVAPVLAIEAPAAAGEADLLDLSPDHLEAPPVSLFMAPAPLQPAAAPGAVYHDTFQPVAAPQQAPAYYEPHQSMNAPLYAPQDTYVPQTSAYQNFQYQQSSHDIMNQYNASGVASASVQAPGPPHMFEMNVEDCTEIVAVEKEQPPVKLSMNNSVYLHDVDEDADEVTKATSMLCNLDSLTQASKAAMVLKSKAELQRNATVVTSVDKQGNKVVKSKGLPPKNAAGNMGNMTMQEMQSAKQQQGQSQRQVMQSYAGNPGAQSNQMVMHGQTAPAPHYQQQQPYQQQQQQRVPANGGYANYAY